VGGVVVWLAGHAHLSCLNLRQWITIGVDIHSFIHLLQPQQALSQVPYMKAWRRCAAATRHGGSIRNRKLRASWGLLQMPTYLNLNSREFWVCTRTGQRSACVLLPCCV
jgi:hypothetical protein